LALIEADPMSLIFKQSLRLTIVENDDNDLFFLQRALTKAGFTPPSVRLKDGQYAIEYFSKLQKESCPHAVLLDLKMPRKDGFDVLRWLRQNPAYETLPVFMLSSSDEPLDIAQAKSLKATHFFQKRNRYSEVMEGLEELISKPPKNLSRD
jgi:CheY-like chemotaxis protein